MRLLQHRIKGDAEVAREKRRQALLDNDKALCIEISQDFLAKMNNAYLDLAREVSLECDPEDSDIEDELENDIQSVVMVVY